ncbi:MAG: alpha-amylase domain-containing protein, partial [Desemzia incerta]
LMQKRPTSAVTFVDNHDSQPSQALESYVEPWFKPLAYSIILLRKYGYPTVFYGDYYGLKGENPIDGQSEILDKLICVRKNYAYGEQVDYIDHANCIGWTRSGDEDHPDGLAVVLSNSEEGFKEMSFGEERAGEVFYDYLGHRQDEVTLDENGVGIFPVNAGSVSAWVKKVNE